MGLERPHFQTFTVLTFCCLLYIGRGARPEVRGKVGGAAELECGIPPPGTAVSPPLHVVEWVHQGIDIPVLIKFGSYAPRVHPKYEGRVSLVRRTALRVKDLALEDRGLYECRILLLNEPADDLHNGSWTLLSVTAPPTFTKTSPPVLEALVGNQLFLACVANGNPTPTITWLKDGDVIREKNIEVQNGTLSLRALTMQSGGQYTCLASNPEGNVTHVMKLRIKGPPVIVVPPRSTSLNMSQNAFLRCQAVADPPNMTYVWQKGGENVHHIESLKSRVKIMVDGTLLISALLPEDSGNYTCMPTNGLLTAPTASANLTVMHPAMALQMPIETYLPTGMEGLVTCPVVAQPPLLHVDWTKDGGALDLALYPGWTLTQEGSVLMATVNDDAAGVYRCTPYNSYGSMGSSGPTRVILQDPPSFSITPQKQYRQEAGRTVLIPCQGNADLVANVTWSKVGPAPRSVYSVLANGSLLLQPLSKDHQGEWECTATNRVASVKARTLVLVLGTSPHAASSLSVLPRATEANVSWEAGFDGGAAQTFSVWVKQISVSHNKEKQDWFSVPVPSSSSGALQVTGLLPATEYQFSVLSHNRVGTGPFSEITSIRTLDPPPRRSQLKPPVSLSANQAPAGIILQWSPPAVQHPPITGFVLQSRAERGEWFNLGEDIGANSSEIIVPGLRKDCEYELRLLSRRGDLLSEPSPSVNVSTVGMEAYSGTSRLLEFAPERVLAGVMGGVGFVCLLLLLLLGSACVISHKRERRRKKRKDELPPAIYKCPPSIRMSDSGSPDSMLKKSLLHSDNLYPTISSSASSSSSSSSSSQSDGSSCSEGGHAEYQAWRPEPQSSSRYGRDHTQGRVHLARAVSSPIPPALELITRGPDGRFIDQPYDRASRLSVRNKGGLRKDHSSVQRSVSLRSERGDRKEPPFVLSVVLPPCGPVNSAPAGRVQPATAQCQSLHGRRVLDEEGGYEGSFDQSSLHLAGSHRSVTFPHPERDTSPAYPILKSINQPLTTASTLVLQMEHERERGNLSRCLMLAQEREELERELRRYTLERKATGERRREEPGAEAEEGEEREMHGDELAWHHKSGTFPHSRRFEGSRRSRGLSSSDIYWEAPPLTSGTAPAQIPLGRSPPASPTSRGSSAQHPVPLFTKQTSLGYEVVDSHSNGRLTIPRLSSKHQRHERVELGPGGFDNSPQSTDTVMQRNESRSEAWTQNNPSHGSLSMLSSSHTNKYAEKSNLTVAAVPESSKAKIRIEDMCIEMSVDEPDLEVSVVPPTKAMLHRRAASLPQHRSEDSFNGQTPTPGEAVQRPPGSHLWKATSPRSLNWDRYQRSQSLDSRRKTQSHFLTPDAWIDSLSQENCSSPFSFRPDSRFWGPRSSPALDASKSLGDSPSGAPSPPPQPLQQPPPASAPPPSVDPLGARRCPQKLTPNPAVPCHHDPRIEKSTLPVASKWPITYQETLRSVQHMDTTGEVPRRSLPLWTERGQRDKTRPPDSKGRPPHASPYRRLVWLSQDQSSSSPPEGKKTRRDDEEEEEEEEEDERHTGHDAEVEIHVGGYGGSYSSYASSGRGSMEQSNGRLSICLSPTLTMSPETVEEGQGHAEDKGLHQVDPITRRKASVDENYEWDTADVCSQPGDHDGLLPSVDLRKSAPRCSRSLPSMQRSSKALKDCSQLSLLQGHRQSSCYSETEIDTVLF